MALAAVAAVLGASASPVHYAWPAYHNNSQLYAEWEALATGSCSDRVKLATEDTTVDGWDLKTASFGTGKTKVMYVFGIHGREYLGAEVGLALMRRLCEKDDPRITKLLSDATFKLFPLMNPSGRAGNLPEKKISGEHDEECVLRRTNANQVDLNRNFDVHWGDGESTPGAVDYRGTAPQTEVETTLLAKAGHEFQPDLYVDVHTGACTAQPHQGLTAAAPALAPPRAPAPPRRALIPVGMFPPRAAQARSRPSRRTRILRPTLTPRR